MSRSGYIDDCEDQWALIRYRGAVKASLKGKRGQAFLRELIGAMDAMPVKELIGDSLQEQSGAVCALGAVGVARKMDLSVLNPKNITTVSASFGISEAMAREIVYENDEGSWANETPAQRYERVRAWAQRWVQP